MRFNELYKEVRATRGAAKGTIKATWMNIAFTSAGLQTLNADGLDAFPQDFREGMAAQAAQLGDVDGSAPSKTRDMVFPPSTARVSMAAWVHTTGGDYFFSPSLPALRQLAGLPA